MAFTQHIVVYSPIMPFIILTEAESMVVAIIETTATVMAKSKLDILEQLRLPKIRLRKIIARIP